MEVKPGYKQTEVGVLPEEWQVKRIDQVADANWGNTAITKDAYREAGYPAYSASGLDGFVSWFDHDKPAVILSAIGAQCGKTWFATDKWTAIKNTIWIRGEDGEATSEFIYCITGNPSFWPNRGQAQPFIALGDVRAAKIPVPPLPEQRAIAAALGDVDALLRGLDRIIAKKRDLKQAAMQQLLTGQARLPGFSGEWEAVEFGELGAIRGAKVVPSSMPTGTQCVELDSIASGTGQLLMSIEARGLFSKYSFKRGDVLFGRLRAYLRKYWLATFDGVCSTEIWPLIARDERLSGGFLHLLVQTNDFLNAAGVSYGTHMPRSDWSVLKTLLVRLPPIPEQTAIAAVLSDMDAELAALEARRDKTRDLKQAMMQELLTGKTRLVKLEAAHA